MHNYTYAHLNVHLHKLWANSVIYVCNYSTSRICNNTLNMWRKWLEGEEGTEGRRMVSIFNSISIQSQSLTCKYWNNRVSHELWWYLAPKTTILILQSHVRLQCAICNRDSNWETTVPLSHVTQVIWGTRGYHLYVPHLRVVPTDISPPTEKSCI